MYYISIFVTGFTEDFAQKMRKAGILKQADSRKIHPAPSGIVTPSDVEIRKPLKIAVEEVNDKIRDPDINDGNRNITQFSKLETRDPNLINTHIIVNFEDVLGEPHGVRSLDCLWIKYQLCYTCCKNLLYKCSSILCGVPLAVVYGCIFASLAFPNIWILTPFSKTFEICCTQMREFVKQCVLCALGAPCEACGQLFWAFNKLEYRRPLMLGKRQVKVKFSDKIHTKRIPARRPEDKDKPLTRFQVIRLMARR